MVFELIEKSKQKLATTAKCIREIPGLGVKTMPPNTCIQRSQYQCQYEYPCTWVNRKFIVFFFFQVRMSYVIDGALKQVADFQNSLDTSFQFIMVMRLRFCETEGCAVLSFFCARLNDRMCHKTDILKFSQANWPYLSNISNNHQTKVRAVMNNMLLARVT